VKRLRRRVLAAAAACCIAGPGWADPATRPTSANPSLGLPALPTPPPPLAALGRKLFFDRRLSANGTLSCAMCHVAGQAFTANEVRTSVGMNGVSLRRNAPTLLNVAHVRRLFVDGRAASLEAQALQPLVHPDEMANASLAAVIARIDGLADYRAPLQAAFHRTRASSARVASALAAYQRTLIAADSKFDRWYFGHRADALDATEQRGFALFQQHGCVQCHRIAASHALFTDGAFHNVGVQARTDALRRQSVDVVLAPGTSTSVTRQTLRRIGVEDAADLGRQEVTGRTDDRRAFRTPSLRNVALTGPYMHDGSFSTLAAVVDYYAGGGMPSDPAQDPRIRVLTLDAADSAALVAFLGSLTSPVAASLGRR
jgi:cytochrome c peroxidase